ncbi:hypothetical protein BG004_007948 [Podila humilis]|nr:hypothetical protein BG004_007948 [Podila humilis]
MKHPDILQSFRYENDDRVATLPTTICYMTGKRYVLWSEIYDACGDADYLTDSSGEVITFMLDSNGNQYQPLRIEYTGESPYTILLHSDPKSDYDAICKTIFDNRGCRYDFSTSRLFIILPTELESLKSSSTCHQFRLYFLCDVWSYVGNGTGHVHLANHPGYQITHLGDFIRLYGDYVLQILLMLRHGYADGDRRLLQAPSKILSECDAEFLSRHIKTYTISSLVDETISYLRKLSPPKWSKYELSRAQSAALRSYLQISDGDNAEGNLHRYTTINNYVRWLCRSHVDQAMRINQTELITFCEKHKRQIDIQQALLKIVLDSKSDADEFLNRLNSDGYYFKISLVLKWPATRLEIEEICHAVTSNNCYYLELDGVSQIAHPHNLIHCTKNLFADKFMGREDLCAVLLQNYPEPGEQYIYIDKYGIRLRNPSPKFTFSWYVVRDDLDVFGLTVCSSPTESECKAAAQELQEALRRYGFPQVTEITIFNKAWDAVFDMETAQFIEVSSASGSVPQAVYSAMSLRRLILGGSSSDLETLLAELLGCSPHSEELSFEAPESDALKILGEFFTYIEETLQRRLSVTAIERMKDTPGRITARGIFGVRAFQRLAQRADSNTERVAISRHDADGIIDDSVAISWTLPLSAASARFLASLSQYSPSALVSLTLDITGLSARGLGHVAQILRISRLECLRIVCNPIRSDQVGTLPQVLVSIPSPTLKSLVFSGTHINDWTEMWPDMTEAYLFSLQLIGTISNMQMLSHKSALAIHLIASASPLTELIFENIVPQAKCDWSFLLESVDTTTLEILGLCNNGFQQLFSFPRLLYNFICATSHTAQTGHSSEVLTTMPFSTLFGKLFSSVSVVQPNGTQSRQVLLSSLVIDSQEPLDPVLVPIHNGFRHCTIRNLTIICQPPENNTYFDAAKDISHAIWSCSVCSLTLSGEELDEWVITLEDALLAADLVSFRLCGTGAHPQNLSVSSALILRELATSSPRITLQLQGIHLEETEASGLEGFEDWLLDILCPYRVAAWETLRTAVDDISLTSKTIDLSTISRYGLRQLQKTCKGQHFLNLRIICSSIGPELPRLLADELNSVRWSELRTLSFQGTHLDDCISLLYFKDTRDLELLEIQGDDNGFSQALSMSSAMLVQHLIERNADLEVKVKNVHLATVPNWWLKGVDTTMLNTVGLFYEGVDGGSGKVENYEAKMNLGNTTPSHEPNLRASIAGMHILDIPWSTGGIEAQVHGLLQPELCRLTIVCNPINPVFHDRVIDILQMTPWQSLTSLTLTGQDINQWLELLPNSTAPLLKQLWIESTRTGDEGQHEILSETGTSALLGLVRDSLDSICIQNVVLQTPGVGWVKIMECLAYENYSMTLCAISKGNLLSSRSAADMYRAYFPEDDRSEAELPEDELSEAELHEDELSEAESTKNERDDDSDDDE